MGTKLNCENDIKKQSRKKYTMPGLAAKAEIAPNRIMHIGL